MIGDVDEVAIASSAADALAAVDVTEVRLGDVIDAGSSRSVVWRARAERRSGPPLDVVIKAPIGEIGGFVRERAGLSLVAEHDLPGAVRLLGWSEDRALLVLEDLGEGPSVADLLLADDSVAAERALVDWAVTVGRLQASSAGLVGEFHARLNAPVRLEAGSSGMADGPAARDLLAGWLAETADMLQELLGPLDVRPGAAASRELRALTPTLGAPGAAQQGLVPGDTCPDNALYVDGELKLLDFEAATYRHVAWEAAYLIVPWPTCWCSWALPEEVAQRALSAWRQTVAPIIPEVTTERFQDDLAQAVIGWSFLTLTFLLPRALADPDPNASALPADSRPRPGLRPLVLYRLGVLCAYITSVLPALRELACQIHEACITRWGQQNLELAPAFREKP